MVTKRRIHEIVQVAAPGDFASRIFTLTILTLIILNVLAIVAESISPLYHRFGPVFRDFEIVSVAAFTIEYFLRVWSCVASPSFSHPVLGRLRFAATPMAIVDLLAVLPFYLPFLGVDLRVIRIVRVFRLFRVAKLARYSTSLRRIHNVLRGRKEELLISFSAALVLLILASSLMYYVEHSAQPRVFSSIPAAMWWGISTLTTVGYGDTYPITPLGKMLGGLIAVFGIGMFALPTAILGGGFIEELQKNRAWQGWRAAGVCPHCGRNISDQ